ncbi:MAG TPA: GAF domain-containing protein, partial [Turneriella sp.]|nr:GAF domain-containing protein [Turneriella sp.]
MGLRERASDYSKTVGSQSGIDLGLELKPDTAEKRVAQEKKPLSLSPSTHENNAPPTTPPLSSADFPENMGHKSRLDAVLNLVEIYKEFGQVRSAKDLWEIVAYSLMAQLGTKYVAIFMEDEMRMELKHALGFTLASDYSFAANSTLAQALAREKKVLYTDDFIASFSEREEKFITQLNARYAVPVFRYEELRGVILVNPPQGRNTFDSDDLFYLKLCGELLGAMEAQLRLIAGAEK